VGQVVDVVRVPLPDSYRERYTLAGGPHVDLLWEFRSEARLASTGHELPVQLRFVGCGRCVSPEVLSGWRLVRVSRRGTEVLWVKGDIQRPSPPSN
jgi:hypothetical protein